ncbi:glycosyltransferase family 2 protein [Candidatus Parabeggiatoa sp. HSG14]|uniref:glycosyltransferase family 2 protein n=1 Tax=Candidatus Parabeggiatoa sp. HSG14 TaxID=3055593 RepID=UPI0025A7B45A|nr:glycosyltransferase family 2 protein [Thiotrichales bacterium HSG14]
MLKSIGIIVLNWQGWRDTLACLNSLKTLSYGGFISIIVCDNNSNDDSFFQILNWAKQQYPPSEIDVFPSSFEAYFDNPKFKIQNPKSFVLIQTGANLGFAGGNNVGIRYALACQNYQYLWLLNNDTVVEVHALSALFHYAEAHPHIALMGSTVVDYEQQDSVQCAGGCRYFPLLTIFKPVLGGQSLEKVLQYKGDICIDYIYGAAMFLKVATVQKVGLLNEEYFLFYEELDYTARIKQQGYEIGWCQKSLVYHKGSASVGHVRDNHRDKLRRANYYENLSTLKYTANFHQAWLPLVMVLRFLLKSLALIIRGDFYLFIPLFKAYRDFMYKK